ncbi:unnamed protein product, partial [Sphacelaria rigidula]
MLFGYCYADPKRTLLTSRDRNSINHDLGARVCSKMVADVITRKSGDGKRLCRALLRYMLEHNWDTSVEIRRQNGVIPLLQKQYREMYPGKVLVSWVSATELVRRVADVRGLEVEPAASFMDEGASLVKGFFAELQTLERQDIRVEGRSWVSPIVDDILRITGAQEVAAVDFPQQMGSK